MSNKGLIAGLVLTFAVSATASADSQRLEHGFDAARGGEYDRAASVFQPLAQGGNAQAQFNLGLMYHSGLGVKRDEAQAVRLYHEAANNGYLPAQEYVAAGYLEGWFGMPKNSEKARYWLQRIAPQ
jgi:TPR repeat protein